MSELEPGITRRELLRKGAKLGGAVVWLTPVVQTVGMGPAFAASPSSPTEGQEGGSPPSGTRRRKRRRRRRRRRR